jgi:hypothetical protein
MNYECCYGSDYAGVYDQSFIYSDDETEAEEDFAFYCPGLDEIGVA